jgi:hypothetical protein
LDDAETLVLVLFHNPAGHHTLDELFSAQVG